MERAYARRVDNSSAQAPDATRWTAGDHVSSIDLKDLLAGVVHSARTLSGARCGALDVVGDTPHHLVPLVAQGARDDEHARVGRLPGWDALLGRLIDHPRPLRLDHLATHPASPRSAPATSPTTTFLGVPVMVHGQAFGTLCLTDKTTGPVFTAEDERGVVAMAHLAGIALEHAHVLAISVRHARWLDATALVPADVLRARLPRDALVAVLDRALEAAHGVAAFAIAPASSGRFEVRAAVGDRSVDPARTLEELHPALMLAMASSRTRSVTLADRTMVMTRLVLDPLTRGALVVVLPAGRLTADASDDLDLLADYARQASQALERHHARAVREEIAVLAERNRIARDLHDVVIQRIFALGLQLTTISGDADARTAARLGGVIADLDATIGEIRRSIVDLRPADRAVSVRGKVRSLVAEYAHVLGHSPTLRMSGPVDTLLAPVLADHLVATLREALSNVARHAAASRVWLSVDVTPVRLTCTVADDGVGCERSDSHGGLRNLSERAAELGGTFRLDGREPHGSLMTWQVPL